MSASTKKAKKQKDLIVSGLDKDLEKLLVSRGVPQHDFLKPAAKFNVEECLVKIVPEIPLVKAGSVSVNTQITALRSILEHPLRTSNTFCISSFPSDARAKHLAIYIMAEAVRQHLDGVKKHGRYLPLWHRVYGNFADSLRDKTVQEIPGLLVITNVNYESSSIKLEKVRDLLEKYSETPKIVVTGGCNPINLFANKLYYPLRAGFYLGANKRTTTI